MNNPIDDLKEKLDSITVQIRASEINFNRDDIKELKQIRDEYQSAINVVRHFKEDSSLINIEYATTVGKNSVELYVQITNMRNEIEQINRRRGYLYHRINVAKNKIEI